MITITVYGGLGNQLFQLFTLLAYNCRSGNKIALFNSLLSCKRPNVRGELSVYWDTPLFSIFNELFCHDDDKYNDFKTIKWTESHYVSLEEHLSEAQIKDGENILLQGCFQSYLYFNEEKDAIFKAMKLQQIKDDISKKYSYDYQNTTSVHFRIGDYINLQQYHPLLSYHYYVNALNQLKIDTNKKDWNVLYFYEKNDQQYIDKVISMMAEKVTGVKFIPIDHNIEDWEQMMIMSLCAHNIIANSTFSWCGSYFGGAGRKVYYPDTWYGPWLDYIDTKMLFPPNWIKISNKNE